MQRLSNRVIISPTDMPFLLQCADYINNEDIDTIVVAATGQGTRVPLSFLTKITSKRIKSLLTGAVSGIENICSLTNLEELVLTPRNGETFDITQLPRLRRLDCDNASAMHRLNEAKLTYFGTGEINFNFDLIKGMISLEALSLYGVKSFDFNKITLLRNLRHITARLLLIKDLAGIENLMQLESLSIVYCKSLQSISGIERLKNLREVYIANCPKLVAILPLSELNSLEILHLDAIKASDIRAISNAKSIGKLMLSSCGNVPSLDFIADMPNLEFLSFVNTNIVDGDLMPCLRLKYVGTLNKKHYNIKEDKLPNQITRFHPPKAEIVKSIEINFSK